MCCLTKGINLIEVRAGLGEQAFCVTSISESWRRIEKERIHYVYMQPNSVLLALIDSYFTAPVSGGIQPQSKLEFIKPLQKPVGHLAFGF